MQTQTLPVDRARNLAYFQMVRALDMSLLCKSIHVYGSFVREYASALNQVMDMGACASVVQTCINMSEVMRTPDDLDVLIDFVPENKIDNLTNFNRLNECLARTGIYKIKFELIDGYDENSRYRGRYLVCLWLPNPPRESDDDKMMRDPEILFGDAEECEQHASALIDVDFSVGGRKEIMAAPRDFDVNSMYLKNLNGAPRFLPVVRKTIHDSRVFLDPFISKVLQDRLRDLECHCVMKEPKTLRGVRRTFVRMFKMLVRGFRIINIDYLCMYANSEANECCVVCRNSLGARGLGFSCCKRPLICAACIKTTLKKKVTNPDLDVLDCIIVVNGLPNAQAFTVCARCIHCRQIFKHWLCRKSLDSIEAAREIAHPEVVTDSDEEEDE